MKSFYWNRFAAGIASWLELRILRIPVVLDLGGKLSDARHRAWRILVGRKHVLCI